MHRAQPLLAFASRKVRPSSSRNLQTGDNDLTTFRLAPTGLPAKAFQDAQHVKVSSAAFTQTFDGLPAEALAKAGGEGGGHTPFRTPVRIPPSCIGFFASTSSTECEYGPCTWWRRGWDSNPRCRCQHTCSPGTPNRPLSHLSAAKCRRGGILAWAPSTGKPRVHLGHTSAMPHVRWLAERTLGMPYVSLTGQGGVGWHHTFLVDQVNTRRRYPPTSWVTSVCLIDQFNASLSSWSCLFSGSYLFNTFRWRA